MRRELVSEVLRGGAGDRVPAGFWKHFLPDETVDGLADPSLIDQNIAGHAAFIRDFDPDFVKIMTDGFFIYPVDAFRFGETAEELGRAAPLGASHPWIERQVAFAKVIRKLAGGDRMTFYNIFAPATLFRFSRGNRDALPGLLEKAPEAALHALEAAAKDLVTLTRRLLTEAGVDGIYYSVQDIAGVEEGLRERAQAPLDALVLGAACELSPCNILHICGFGGRRNDLAHYAAYPAGAVNWATAVEGVALEEGRALFGGRAVIGGFDNRPEGVLYRGGRPEIEAEAARILRGAGEAGVILGADCTVPRDISLEHLRWARGF